MSVHYLGDKDTAILHLGEWTLTVFAGRKAGSLPEARPEVVLHKGVYDERKLKEIAEDRLTPADADFSQVLLEALRSHVVGAPVRPIR